MEVKLEQLKESIKSSDWKRVSEIILELEKTHPKKIPINMLKTIIEQGSGRAPTHSMRILSNLALQDEEARQSFFQYLSSPSDGLRCLAFMAMTMSFSTSDYVILPSNVVLRLIQDPVPGIRKSILSILLSIAKKIPNKIPIYILYKAMLKEEDALHREQILKIANIINPVDQPSRTIKIDTLYLINWIRKQASIQSTKVHELLGDICAKYIGGSQEFHLVRALITESCVVDAFLFLMPKRYRGHEIHQFNVGVLGLFLLKMYISDSETLEEYIRKLKKWKDCEDVEKCWLVTAFLHDHAIPIEYMFKTAPITFEYGKIFPSYSTAYKFFHKALDEAYHNLISSSLFEIYEKLLSGQDVSLRLKELISEELTSIGYVHSVEKNQILDHGILAAVNLTTRLRSKNDDFVDKNDLIKTAAKAIALHNSSDKVELKKEPIAFLLVLCDEIQEWEREVAFLPHVAAETSSIEIGPFKHEQGKLLFEDELSVTFDYSYGSRETLKQTGWDYKIFKNGKNSTEKRLVFDPNIRPKKIVFKTLA